MRGFLIAQLFLLLSVSRSAAQTPVPELLSWSGGQCDRSVNSFYMINRISELKVVGNTVELSISVKANCCDEFHPAITFRNDTLRIQPDTSSGSRPKCGCNCCFCLKFVIGNLNDTSFVTLFRGQKLTYSSELYRTVPVVYEIYNGDTINRRNRYGVATGYWMTKYETGEVRIEQMFAANPDAFYEQSTWKKVYYQSGKLWVYDRNDTNESWYENGQLRYSKYIAIDNGDMITSTTSYYDNGQLKEVEIEKTYGEDRRVYDTLSGGYHTSENLRHEKYYANGQPEYLPGDTAKWWYENGALKKWQHGDTATEYYSNGTVYKSHKVWYLPYNSKAHGLQHVIYREYHPNGQLASIHFVRDEVVPGGRTNAHYNWKWSETGELTEAPKEWNEPMPAAPKKQN